MPGFWLGMPSIELVLELAIYAEFLRVPLYWPSQSQCELQMPRSAGQYFLHCWKILSGFNTFFCLCIFLFTADIDQYWYWSAASSHAISPTQNVIQGLHGKQQFKLQKIIFPPPYHGLDTKKAFVVLLCGTAIRNTQLQYGLQSLLGTCVNCCSRFGSVFHLWILCKNLKGPYYTWCCVYVCGSLNV